LTVPTPHWNNGFCKVSTGYGCQKIGFNLELATDKDIRSETLYSIFWGFKLWNKCLVTFDCERLWNKCLVTFDLLEKVAHCTIIYILSSETYFQFLVQFRVYLCIIKDPLLDSFRIRILRLEPQQELDTNIIFFKEDRIG